VFAKRGGPDKKCAAWFLQFLKKKNGVTFRHPVAKKKGHFLPPRRGRTGTRKQGRRPRQSYTIDYWRVGRLKQKKKKKRKAQTSGKGDSRTINNADLG